MVKIEGFIEGFIEGLVGPYHHPIVELSVSD